MKLIYQTDNAKMGSLWQTDVSVLFRQQSLLMNLSTNYFLQIDANEKAKGDSIFIYVFSPKKISIYNHLFQLKKVIKHDIINAYSIRTFGSLDNYVLYEEEGEKVNQHIFCDGTEVKTLNNVLGRILNTNYRLCFNEGVFNEPTYFWLSDLLNEKIYWDYHVPDGLKVITPFTIWQNQLFFEAFDFTNHLISEKLFISLDLQTGQEVANLSLKTLYHQFDPGNGKLYGLIGVHDYHNKEKQLEIIDLTTGSVDIQEVHSDEPLYGIYPNNSTLDEKYLYFVDMRYGKEERLCHHPRFGRLDLTTNKVDYIHEPPEARGEQFGKPIINNDKIYLRTSGEKLFVFA